MDFFKGTRYFLSDMWFNVIDLTEFINRPINYLEIGTFPQVKVGVKSFTDSYMSKIKNIHTLQFQSFIQKI